MAFNFSAARRVAGQFLMFAAAVTMTALVASPGEAQSPIRTASHVTFTNVSTDPTVDPYSQWKPQYIRMQHAPLNIQTLKSQALSGLTIPFWTSSVTSPLDTRTYETSMVGANPFTSPSVNMSIPYVPIVLRVHFRGGITLAADAPSCSDTVPIATRFFNSPIFQPQAISSNNVPVGNVQLVSGFQRANFWTSVAGHGYGVTLVQGKAPVVLDVNAPSGSRTIFGQLQCGNTVKTVHLGLIDINAYDQMVETIIAQRALPSQLPIILTYNVVQTIGSGCCVLGYHNAVPVARGTQTYAVGSYIDSGIFFSVDDVVVWTHELGEWMDDPFVQASVPGGFPDDLTPPWGNVGQVLGCQNNLEVGDPLSGTEFGLLGTGGFLYHLQDLAFEDWFYRTPSHGTAGSYSFAGVFTAPQGVCH